MQLRKEFKKLKIKNIKIQSLHREIQDLRTGIVKGQSFNGMPKTPSNDNRTEDLNIKITDKIDELYKKIEQEQAEQEFLTKAIESLEDPIENIVMRLLYINNLSWSEVERRLNCSPATIKRVVDRAFANLSKIFDNNDSV
nr:MAG TPA: RNA polymerase sigma factor [Caudoviricetes sp.]